MDNNVLVISGVLFLGVMAGIAKAAGALQKLKKKVIDAFSSSDTVGLMADVVFELAFNGSVVAGFLGFSSDRLQEATLMLFFVTALWFFSMLRLHVVLRERKAYLDELAMRAKVSEQRRKTAGMMRSIVRSEVARASAPDKEKWID